MVIKHLVDMHSSLAVTSARQQHLYPIPNTPFETVPKKLRQQLKCGFKAFLDTDCIENIVETGEIAHFEKCHLFPLCFPKF